MYLKLKCVIDYTTKIPVFPSIWKHLVIKNNVIVLLFVNSIPGINF